MWKLLIGAAVGYIAGRSQRDFRSMRPAVKAALRTGVRAFEKGTEAMAHLRESLDDIAAEVRADLETQAAAERTRQESAEPEPVHSPRRRSSKRKLQPEAETHAPTSHD